MQQSFSVENDDREKCRIRAGIFYMAEIVDKTAIKRDRKSMSASARIRERRQNRGGQNETRSGSCRDFGWKTVWIK